MNWERPIPEIKDKAAKPTFPVMSDDFREQCPALASYLGTIPKGAPQNQYGCFTFFWDEPVWKCVFRDRPYRQLAWLNVEVLTPDLLVQLDGILRGDSIIWYEDKKRR